MIFASRFVATTSELKHNFVSLKKVDVEADKKVAEKKSKKPEKQCFAQTSDEVGYVVSINESASIVMVKQ